jgi:uncharacterized membrane protein
MGDYERQRAYPVNADRLFDYLADIEHLPDYFESMTSARRGDGDEVVTTAEVDGHEVEGTAEFRVDREARRLDWSSEAPNDYHGWLAVTDAGDGAKVELHVSTAQVETDGVNEGIDRTLDNIEKLVSA